MEITTVHLMRHGEVDNPDGVLYGRKTGFGLTALGVEMAQTVADFLVAEQRDITNVIASPLLRAQESALPTSIAYGVPIQTDRRLVEAGSKFEGMQINKNRWALAHPRNWKHFVRPHQPSWGEPYFAIAERMTAVVSTALEEARGHEALVVSHQLPIVTVQRFLEGKPLSHLPTHRRCALASLTSLMFEDNTLVGWSYCEPAEELVKAAHDMSPGSSKAALHR